MKRVVALALWASSCGSPPPAAYVSESREAEAAKRRGDFESAARHYERAAGLSLEPRDADEARYRAAEAYLRGGKLAEARALFASLARGNGERAARAELQQASLLSREGRAAAADAARVRAIQRHPDSGLARDALRKHLDYLRARGGTDAVVRYLQGDARALRSSELGETVAYRLARELDDAGRASAARDAYLACAADFPYPAGAYWDDALFRAAEQELKLGAPEQALAHLGRLLAERESAHITGSYERGRYAEAQLKIAEVFRDYLRDEPRARRELRRVWEQHRTSRLADDALFEEARLAHGAGDVSGACQPLRLLVTHLPESRYAPCAVLLCPHLTQVAPAPSACRDYIKRAAGLP